MKLAHNTFGRTPAAMYLARLLNDRNDSNQARSVGKQITATNRAVNELTQCYEAGALSAKTLANVLRLMRSEVTNGEPLGEPIIDQLRRNIQIGLIKRGIRLSTVARKAERVMSSPDARAARRHAYSPGPDIVVESFYFNDSTTNTEYHAGDRIHIEGEQSRLVGKIVYPDDVGDVTPELLMQRSDRRCARQGKPHMLGVAA